MSKILLIGGAGFIGSNIVEHLLFSSQKYSIFVLEPEFASLHRIEQLPITVFRGELNNFELLKDILLSNNIDTVVHLVSTLIPGSSFDDYQKEFSNMIFPSIRLMELCSELSIKFVYFSSGGTVYGDRRNDGVPFSEENQMAPISYYGWSKQMMENSILYMHRTKNLEYVILRPSNPYGKGQYLYGKQGFIAVALGKILAGKSIQIWGKGDITRDYIYIDDLGKAVVEILSNSLVVNKTLNIGSGVGYTINDIIRVLRTVVKENFSVEYLPARNVDVSSVVLDITKLRSVISFNPRGILEGVTEFYNVINNEQ